MFKLKIKKMNNNTPNRLRCSQREACPITGKSMWQHLEGEAVLFPTAVVRV